MSRQSTATRGHRADRDAYLQLVMRFPLRPLKTEREYDAAAELLDSLVLRTDLSAGEKDYVDALSLFIDTSQKKAWWKPLS